MENDFGHVEEDEPIVLPPGFGFYPTDKELICELLYEKVLNSNFSSPAVGEVDLNKIEPWDIPWKAKMGEYEWYNFILIDKRHPTSKRTKRATPAGYWKATGKDIEIYKGKEQVGKKKILVFYLGRAPNAEKTNWVLHEYKLAGIYSPCNLPITAQNDWIICRVFEKTAGGKKMHISELTSYGNGSSHMLPPSMDSPSPMLCISGTMQHNQMQQNDMIDSINTFPVSFPPEFSCSMNVVNMQYHASASMPQQDHNNGPIMKKAEITQHEGPRDDIYPPVDPDNWQQPFGEHDQCLSASSVVEDIDYMLDCCRFGT